MVYWLYRSYIYFMWEKIWRPLSYQWIKSISSWKLDHTVKFRHRYFLKVLFFDMMLRITRYPEDEIIVATRISDMPFPWRTRGKIE